MSAAELAVVAAVSLTLVLPHLLPLERVHPATAASVWFCALSLRALVAIGGAIFAFVYMPRTGVYDAVAHWCWHEAVPVLASHLGLSGHPLVHAAIVLPGLTLAGSVLWVLFGLARAWLALRTKLRSAVGEGPLGSMVIADDEILVGVTGLGRSRIVVSDVALGSMDAAELEASLSHELGHIRRRHRPLLVAASVLAALGKLLPGTRVAESELRFSLERDADEYAVGRTRDPLSLASAICKAATARSIVGTTGLGGRGRVALRLDYLEGQAESAGRALERGVRLLALALAVTVFALSVTLPSWALATPRAEHAVKVTGAHCATDPAPSR